MKFASKFNIKFRLLNYNFATKPVYYICHEYNP